VRSRGTAIPRRSNAKKGNISMCIYCGTTNYRKIYESHFGSIPIDEEGRSYDIHHIDGNHSNNNPDNLRAVTVQEHYDIHYSQKDYGACFFIATQRMNKTKEEISELARITALQRVENGTHHFLGGKIQRKLAEKRTKEKSNPFFWRKNTKCIKPKKT